MNLNLELSMYETTIDGMHVNKVVVFNVHFYVCDTFMLTIIYNYSTYLRK